MICLGVAAPPMKCLLFPYPTEVLGHYCPRIVLRMKTGIRVVSLVLWADPTEAPLILAIGICYKYVSSEENSRSHDSYFLNSLETCHRKVGEMLNEAFSLGTMKTKDQT